MAEGGRYEIIKGKRRRVEAPTAEPPPGGGARDKDGKPIPGPTPEPAETAPEAAPEAAPGAKSGGPKS